MNETKTNETKTNETKTKYRLKIIRDCSPESPREWDNLWTFVCWHQRYTLGDTTDFREPAHFWEWLKDNGGKDEFFIMPIFMYDHSGIALSTSNESYPFNDIWDSGQLGIAYVSKKAIREEWKVKQISPKLKNTVLKNLNAEIESYNQYLAGDIYGFQLVEIVHCEHCDRDKEENLDSCWGFYGSDPKENGMWEHISDDYKDAEIVYVER